MNDWAAIDWKLVQRERKTEEWVREKDAEDIAKAIMELEDAVEEMQDTRAELEAENAQLRAELAALREHWAHSNPGLADQYRAEAFACRSTLGFDVDSDEVSPRELVDAIKAQPASPEGREQEPVAWIVEHDDYPTEVELHDQFDHTPEARKKDEAMGWRFTPLYKAPQPAIPAGYALVPVEPTPGMIEAGRESLILGDFKKVKNNYERIYKAMLAAKENNNGN